MIAVSHDGTIPYLEEHPTANTDLFTEDERESRCQEGTEFIQRTLTKNNFEFLETTKTEKLKLFLLIDSTADTSLDEPLEVLPAYKCPTIPAIYIHVDLIKRKNEPIYRVIFKDSTSFPSAMKLKSYNLRLVDGIKEGKLA